MWTGSKNNCRKKDWCPRTGAATWACGPVSAIKGTGVSDLLERILLESEIMEIKADPHALPRGTVIEAQNERSGSTATVLIRSGTLKVGDPFICGNYSGKVKLLVDDTGKSIKEAGPSTPVKVLGFAGLPNAGDEFLVMESEKSTKQLSEERLEALRTEKLTTPQRATLESLFDSLADDQRKVLNIILKCDVQGSLEALIGSLDQIESKKIDLEIIHFRRRPYQRVGHPACDRLERGRGRLQCESRESSALNAAKREGVQVKLLQHYLRIDRPGEGSHGGAARSGIARKQSSATRGEKKCSSSQRAWWRDAGSRDGRISRTARARVLRKRQPVYDGGLSTLRHFKDDVKEVRSGMECGLKLGDFNEYEPGDIIECYQLDKIAQKL